MANLTNKFTTVTTGAYNQPPVAVLAKTKIDTLIGAIIQLDGRQSYDPEKQPLTYKWRFVQIPIGSEVESSGFNAIRPGFAAVSFTPDKTGIYLVELVVNDGELDSAPITATVNIQLSRVPCGENIIPNVDFLWSYLSDFWKLVEDREKISALWSAIVQVIGSDLISLWGKDYNKSLDTIQPTFQKRWQKISMLTDVSEEYDQRIIVGKTDSGVNGSSGTIGGEPGVGNTSIFYLPRGSVGDGDKTNFRVLEGNYGAKGRVIVVNGETYTISRVSNRSIELYSADDGATTGQTLTSALADPPGFDADWGIQAGDLVFIRTGADTGAYRVKTVNPDSLVLVYPNDPAGGPYPSFSIASDIAFTIVREFTSVIVSEEEIPDGIVGASWRVPHLLHIPEVDFEANGVRPGDILVFEARRRDIGLTTEVYAQVVGADGDRLGFEFSTTELEPSMNEGTEASVVESGGVVTVSGLDSMRPGSVGGYLEILNGDNPGKYAITGYVSEDAVVIENSLASGADSGNPAIQWVERGKTGSNLERDFFRKIVRDLRIVPSRAAEIEAAVAAETLIRFVPVGINLNTRPFSRYGITLRALRVQHNSKIKVDDALMSAPALQETVIDPPVALRENLDYVVENGYVEFISGLFSLSEPAPEELWAECAIYDNSETIENNFGRLVQLSVDDMSDRRTASPYLSAVKGLFFAYTNGPTVANIRLGLQILLGLPFTEEEGIVLEVQDDFSVDSSGSSLGRILIEDIDEVTRRRTGFRRVYFYPMAVGLETNSATGAPYAVGDTIRRFAPISKGVEVVDYVKDPLWWKQSLYGLEILKYFIFKIVVSAEVFDTDDVLFGLDFVKKIKPAYTRVLATALHTLEEDIEIDDALGGGYLAKFYDNTWGLEATERVGDRNQQGAILWNADSKPFGTRSLDMLDNVRTYRNGSDVEAFTTEWDTATFRGRDPNPGAPNERPTVEGDILVILQGQLGAGAMNPGFYEIGEVLDVNTVRLQAAASMPDPVTLDLPALDPDVFEYSGELQCSVLRRATNPMLVGTDLETTTGSHIVQSASALFMTNLVSPGDHLVVEAGDNLGEYIIDAIPVIEENGDASANFDAGTFTHSVPGLVFDSSIEGLNLVLRDPSGNHLGAYKILSVTGANDLTFENPRGTSGTTVPGDWHVAPVAPFITETSMAVKNLDGTVPSLQAGTGQYFRVIRPNMKPLVVFGAKSVYNAGDTRMELEVMDLGTSDPRDVFTPGMVGRAVNVSESDNPVNDGEFFITEYLNAGRVVIDSASISTDSAASAKVDFAGAP